MSGLTTARILNTFTDEITSFGGEVTDTFNDGRRLFVRSVLPAAEEVKRGDRMRAGVALRADETEVRVHPYLFRLVCRNGAITVHSLGTLSVDYVQDRDPDEAEQMIRELVAECADPSVFRASLRGIRRGLDVDVDTAIGTLALLSRHLVQGDPRFVAAVMDQFFKEGDRSQFGLANAVTALARDTRDPAMRWDLEELGGAMLTEPLPTAPHFDAIVHGFAGVG